MNVINSALLDACNSKRVRFCQYLPPVSCCYTNGSFFDLKHLSGSHSEHRIKSEEASYRPRVNARLMPEAEPRRRFSKYLGWVDPSCPSLNGIGLKGVGGYAVVRTPFPQSLCQQHVTL